MTTRRHELILLSERLMDLLDDIRDAAYSNSSPASHEVRKHLTQAETHTKAAWLAVEEEIANA